MAPDAFPALTPISQPELSHSYAIHVGSMLGVSLLKSFWGHTWACWRPTGSPRSSGKRGKGRSQGCAHPTPLLSAENRLTARSPTKDRTILAAAHNGLICAEIIGNLGH